tara:strand:- start:2889 stop:3167 length:279 start_codon:yes stop_codon:yes gene_type:complete
MAEATIDLSGVDMKEMFEAKMGFSVDEIGLTDDQLTKFLLLCHQTYLQEEGIMESEDESGIEEEGTVKVIKLQGGDASNMMDEILGGHSTEY